MGLTVCDPAPLPDILIWPTGTHVKPKLGTIHSGIITAITIRCDNAIVYQVSLYLNGDYVTRDFYDFEIEPESATNRKKVGFLKRD